MNTKAPSCFDSFEPRYSFLRYMGPLKPSTVVSPCTLKLASAHIVMHAWDDALPLGTRGPDSPRQLTSAACARAREQRSVGAGGVGDRRSLCRDPRDGSGLRRAREGRDRDLQKAFGGINNEVRGANAGKARGRTRCACFVGKERRKVAEAVPWAQRETGDSGRRWELQFGCPMGVPGNQWESRCHGWAHARRRASRGISRDVVCLCVCVWPPRGSQWKPKYHLEKCP